METAALTPSKNKQQKLVGLKAPGEIFKIISRLTIA